MQDFETLGAFYLGRPYDLATRTIATPIRPTWRTVRFRMTVERSISRAAFFEG